MGIRWFFYHPLPAVDGDSQEEDTSSSRFKLSSACSHFLTNCAIGYSLMPFF